VDKQDPGVQLMLAFQAGDEGAFDQIVNQYQGAVFSMLRRFLGPHAGVEDLAQDAFIRLYKARDRYQPAGKLATFLYRISYNLALNRIRDDKRKPSRSFPRAGDGTVLAMPDPNAVEPLGEIGQQDWASLVSHALTELPENQRAALVFQHYDDLDLGEIALIMEISTKAVKSLLHRARQSLRQILQPYKDAEQD
jgi:RNA polymerase sigma-70 factor, ECF subfamily